jgi:hypothetical protein
MGEGTKRPSVPSPCRRRLCPRPYGCKQASLPRRRKCHGEAWLCRQPQAQPRRARTAILPRTVIAHPPSAGWARAGERPRKRSPRRRPPDAISGRGGLWRAAVPRSRCLLPALDWRAAAGAQPVPGGLHSVAAALWLCGKNSDAPGDRGTRRRRMRSRFLEGFAPSKPLLQAWGEERQ